MRIAVVGAGIAGLACAWLLSRRHDVTLYEANETLGGHAHTVDITLDAVTHPVDTGFLVFNHRTYPNLTALFSTLNVPVAASDMSLGISFTEPDLEWAGHDMGSLFAQRRNLVRPGFWRMLADIVRFNRAAQRYTRGDDVPRTVAEESLGAFLDRGRYSEVFRQWYLLPMAGAIWSCPTATMLHYPMATFARFCANHGLLQWVDRPQWYTVRGGSREYVTRIARSLPDVRRGTPVRAVGGRSGAVTVATDTGTERFDTAVLACHSDQALKLLTLPTQAEASILGRLGYQPNDAVLHTDTSLLPRRRATWAAWNYIAGAPRTDGRAVGVTYLLNRLQPLPFQQPVMVTLNAPRLIDPAKVLRRFRYDHPVFDRDAIAAQAELPAIQGRHGVWFCGAWAGYGFHEDGLRSAMAVANALGEYAPWQTSPEAVNGAPTSTSEPAVLPA